MNHAMPKAMIAEIYNDASSQKRDYEADRFRFTETLGITIQPLDLSTLVAGHEAPPRISLGSSASSQIIQAAPTEYRLAHGLSMLDILASIEKLPLESVERYLLKYMDRDAVDLIVREKIDLVKLLTTLLWIELRLGTKPHVGVFIDPEEGFQFIEIYLPCYSEQEWDRLAELVKNEMKRAGLDDLTGEVAIVCPQVLKELLS